MTAAVLASEERAMIRAVLLDPADDAVRLILADWYEEHGQEGLARWVRRSVAEGWPDTIGPHGEMALRVHKDRPPVLIRSDSYGHGSSLTVHRGFVSEWHGPLATFLANVERLFSEQPIERVVLTDRVPIIYEHRPSRRVTFAWWCGANIGRPHILPQDICEHLLGLPPAYEEVRDVAYRNRSEAMDALSTACVAYGRFLAGLPPLPARPA